ncbi:MAG: MBL fold metallo-hydrolase [Myxococcota bacterium]
MRRVLLGIGALVGLAVLALAVVLGLAHRGVRAVRPALPDVAALRAPNPHADLPTGLFRIDTARQPTPRSGVLDPERDPRPSAAYVMTHTAFVLAWPDGRLFLFDAGMDRASAADFGATLETFSGAEPIEVRSPVAERLGPALERVRGAAFSHLHTDHTAGIVAVCQALGRPLPVFQTPSQHAGGNYTTRPGRAQLADAGCVEPVRVDDAPLAEVPGFPGLSLVAASGHTPGSQMLVAHVRTPLGIDTWVFTGDVVNHRDGIRHDVPKPRLYSLLVVPEDTERLSALRALLADAAKRGARLAVSHDAAALDIPLWPPTLPEEG